MTQMTVLQDEIKRYCTRNPGIYKKVLIKILDTMLNKCKYINGESLERHNWGKSPIKLHFIPNIESPDFEKLLLAALDMPENEKSIVELLWGDIQLGKRVHACIIMWISVHVLRRPVLYVFRNLKIDQKQLHDDIVGTENYNFNIQFIKTVFQEFNNELQDFFEENNVDYWKDFKLPELQDINSNDVINKLNNKEAINSNDIFCCLMNHSQLEKINSKFNEYISYNKELVNITVLVDESDLSAPTSSNDMRNKNDKKDTTLCEILLAKIYKKVRYALHITGTAHSLLYNVTTRLNDNTDIQIKISKVHKMKRTHDYFGLFNGRIHFNTDVVKQWWDNNKYDIIEDYNVNIKNIIETIIKRPAIYNSFLISEEKIREKQFYLVDKIMKDFPSVFIIIFHGNCLRLYLSKDYEQEIKRLCHEDSDQSSTSQRLWQYGGVYGSSVDMEKSERLPNNYCYFNINTKMLSIKLVYKLLRLLLEKSDVPIINKTIITITGKYGERGYSFTSDDYDDMMLHLTDQYFVYHSSFNCTNASQSLRLQGKYNDVELKNGTMKLTLWTTPLFKDIMLNFYVKFIKRIEKFIMSCESWEEIKDKLEAIIDTTGDMKFGKYMKYIDVSKKRKNLNPEKLYNIKTGGYTLLPIDEMNETEISEWCKERNLPEYICINEIDDLTIDKFTEKYGNWEYKLEEKTEYFDSEKEYLNYIDQEKLSNSKYENNKVGLFYNTSVYKDKKIYQNKLLDDELGNLKKGSNLGISYSGNGEKINNIKTRLYIGYDDITNPEGIKFHLRICKVLNKTKLLPKQTNDYIKKTPYIVDGDKVKYSVIKEEYKQQNTHGYTNGDEVDFIEHDNPFPETYYWKTPDGWLYLYDRKKTQIYSLEIVTPLAATDVINPNISTDQLINNDILLFANTCFKKAEKTNLRFGLKDVFIIYEMWCKTNGKTILKTQKKFKEELEKIGYKEEKSKGVDVNNKPGKRGFNIMVSL